MRGQIRQDAIAGMDYKKPFLTAFHIKFFVLKLVFQRIIIIFLNESKAMFLHLILPRQFFNVFLYIYIQFTAAGVRNLRCRVSYS